MSSQTGQFRCGHPRSKENTVVCEGYPRCKMCRQETDRRRRRLNRDPFYTDTRDVKPLLEQVWK